MGCLKLPYHPEFLRIVKETALEKGGQPDFLGVWEKGDVLKSGNDYYPFGLTFNSYQRENSTKNKYLYNQGAGKEKFNTERVFDLELNVDQSKYRTYDYSTGRWWQVDPKADAGGQESLTTYQYSFNNPVLYNDPNGDCPPGVDCKAFAKGVWNTLKGSVDFVKDTWNTKGQNIVQAIDNVDALITVAKVAPDFVADKIESNAKQSFANKIAENGSVQGAASEVAGELTSGLVLGIAADKGLSKLSTVTKAVDNVADAVPGLPSPKVGSAGGPGAGKAFSTKVKDAARAESSDQCVLCGTGTTRVSGPTQSNIDHAIPKSRGGNNTIDNAQNTCRTCNQQKGTQTTEEYLRSRQQM